VVVRRRSHERRARTCCAANEFLSTPSFAAFDWIIRKKLEAPFQRDQTPRAFNEGQNKLACQEASVFKKALFAAVVASVALAGVGTADAAGGCGPGFHRGPYGACRANRGPVVVGVGGPALGAFYPGRGYWDGHRYWMHRHAWHGGWRYF